MIARPEDSQFHDGLTNPAVARCCDAWARAHQAAASSGKSHIGIRTDADQAYCRAMPPLSGLDNISDFIACVTYGIVIGAILGPTATRLLYAAQVAGSILKGKKTK